MSMIIVILVLGFYFIGVFVGFQIGRALSEASGPEGRRN
jgi:hypothetical protein